MLTDAQLQRMREQQAVALPDTCSVVRRTYTSDGYGGQTTSSNTVATLACRVTVTSGKEAELAAQITEQRAVTITLPWGSNVLAGDRLVVGAQTFEILSLLQGGDWTTALRVLAVEVVG